MDINDPKKLVALLSQFPQYKILEKYQRPEFYNTDTTPSVPVDGMGSSTIKFIGVFLDIEATGLSLAKDKIIELGMVKFEYTADGLIFRLLDEFNSYQDPGVPIPDYITQLTGITDEMVIGQKIDEDEVDNYLKDVDLIIAHNAQFDRTFFEKAFPNIEPKAWGCLMYDINWKQEGINSHKLEYIAYKYGFFFEGHMAIIDCLAGIHILSQKLIISKELVLKQLLLNSGRLTFKLWAAKAPYEHKDLLRERGYRWNDQPSRSDQQITNLKAWSIELSEDKIEEEISYLRSEIYGNSSSINIPVEILDSYSRFSANKWKQRNNANNELEEIPNNTKYQDKMEWIKMLCLR